MKGFWNDESGFSLKDLYGVLFSICTISLIVLAVVTTDSALRSTILSILGYLAPINLTIIGGYVIQEGTTQIANSYNNRNKEQEYNNEDDMSGI